MPVVRRIFVWLVSVAAVLLMVTVVFSSPASSWFVRLPFIVTSSHSNATPTAQGIAPTQVASVTPAVTATASATSQPSATPTHALAHTIKNVFVIVMENHNWSSIVANPSAPYINGTLLPLASHAERYFNPRGVHPSLPNYLWMEAGSDFGIANDAEPGRNSQSTNQHLVTLLENAGISWKSYQENIDGKSCPLQTTSRYAARHNPMVYFDDVTDNGKADSVRCIAHIRPFEELATDLQQNTVARYNFITPNICNNMHDSVGCPTTDSIKNGDNWLAQHVPTILNSESYKQGGALFITWDEGADGDGPIGMIVLSPSAKGHGYSNTIRYTHSSLLRTTEEIFGITPLLRDAARAESLRDLFRQFP